jgi:hypothetical protein
MQPYKRIGEFSSKGMGGTGDYPGFRQITPLQIGGIADPIQKQWPDRERVPSGC